MKVTLAAIAGRNSEKGFDSLAAVYLDRLHQYTQVDSKLFRSEAALWGAVAKMQGRTAPVVVLLDERGRPFSSAEFAGWIGRQRDEGRQNLIFAVGPADGWREESRAHAGLLLSLSRMTLAHELARVVLAEQVYRAFTILAGHPYHRE